MSGVLEVDNEGRYVCPLCGYDSGPTIMRPGEPILHICPGGSR